MSTDPKTLSISIIIPTRNEASALSSHLEQLVSTPDVEVLVVDGSSTDSTVETARALGAKTLQTAPGRAGQMNAGAAAAQGDILLFLHADTALPLGFTSQIRSALGQPGVAAGAFRLAIGGRGFSLRIVEGLANLRARFLQMPYGDQGIFVTAAMFSALGGYPDLPIMEDFELVRRLKRQGRILILPIKAITSSRRWEKLGVLRTTLINQAMVIAYLLGADPRKLANWYRKG